MRGGGEGPAGGSELRGGEEGADGLVGGAGVAETVQPEHEAAGHGCAGERRRRRRRRGLEVGEEEEDGGGD